MIKSVKFKSDKFTVIEFYKKNFFTTYDSIQVALMKNDKNFIIKGIAGMIFYTENTAACHNKVEEVEFELSEMFSDTKKIERATEPHINDKNSSRFLLINEKSLKRSQRLRGMGPL